MIAKINHRLSKRDLAAEQGFTLIELLVVIVILGILVAIAVPSYLSFRGSAQTAAEKSNVRSAIPAAEGYYQNNNSSYTGLNHAALSTAAPGVSPNVKAVALNSGQGYCLEDSEDSGATTWDYIGGSPGAVSGQTAIIQSGTCLAEAGSAAS